MNARERHQGREARSGLDVGPDLDGAIADDAREGRPDLREGEVALGLGQHGLRLVGGPRRLDALGFEHLDVGAGIDERRLGTLHGCRGPVLIRAGLFEAGPGREIRLRELLLALEIGRRPNGIGARGRDLRLGLSHLGARSVDLPPDPLGGRFERGELVAGGLDGEPVIEVVDPGDDIARPDLLVVADLDPGDVARDLRGQDRDVGRDVSVVGRDHEATIGPVAIPFVPRDAQRDREKKEEDQPLARTLRRLGLVRVRRSLVGNLHRGSRLVASHLDRRCLRPDLAGRDRRLRR